MAAYNSAIYMGRALSFAAVIVAGKLGMAKSTGDIGVTMVRSLNGMLTAQHGLLTKFF